MEKFEAAQLLGLSGTVTKIDIKKAYKEKIRLYHPDRNPAGLHMSKAINVAYDMIKDEEKLIIENDNKNSKLSDYMQHLNDVLSEIMKHPDLIIELCGVWVWISGNTKEHKEILKSSKFKWSNNKKMWYYRPETKKSKNRSSWSINKIRESFGSTKFNDETKKLKSI